MVEVSSACSNASAVDPLAAATAAAPEKRHFPAGRATASRKMDAPKSSRTSFGDPLHARGSLGRGRPIQMRSVEHDSEGGTPSHHARYTADDRNSHQGLHSAQVEVGR